MSHRASMWGGVWGSLRSLRRGAACHCPASSAWPPQGPSPSPGQATAARVKRHPCPHWITHPVHRKVRLGAAHQAQPALMHTSCSRPEVCRHACLHLKGEGDMIAINNLHRVVGMRMAQFSHCQAACCSQHGPIVVFSCHQGIEDCFSAWTCSMINEATGNLESSHHCHCGSCSIHLLPMLHSANTLAS